jgi:site-specific recombinase XerC
VFGFYTCQSDEDGREHREHHRLDEADQTLEAHHEDTHDDAEGRHRELYGDSLRSYLAQRDDFASQHGMQGTNLFLDERRGNSMTPVKVRSIVKKYLSMVTTQQRNSPHVLRHTFATAMLNHNADLQSVKELLGHESLAATQVYTHVTLSELQHNYELAHPRALKKGG